MSIQRSASTSITRRDTPVSSGGSCAAALPISWLLYVVKPSRSYLLNAHFEDHAEHEYMEFVAENPQLESEPFKSLFEEDYGSFESVADMFRQIAIDEGMHKKAGLEAIATARFQ